MNSTAFFAAVLFTASVTAGAAEKDPRVFEMRTYYAAPGKLDALHARFRDHTTKLFAKHGITNIGYWVPIENPDSKLVYVLAFPSTEARVSSKKAFAADPEWKAAQKASEENGKLVAKVESVFMTATDFSPPVQLAKRAEERVFELRTYTTGPGHLPALHARFRDHTVALFAKHGMTNLWYWRLLPDQQDAESTLVYFLAHASTDAARASFAAFRTDPAWVAARTASEAKAGGSLTVKDGVKSVFLKPTDYSPIQ